MLLYATGLAAVGVMCAVQYQDGDPEPLLISERQFWSVAG
jgi:hypothetical protein